MTMYSAPEWKLFDLTDGQKLVVTVESIVRARGDAERTQVWLAEPAVSAVGLVGALVAYELACSVDEVFALLALRAKKARDVYGTHRHLRPVPPPDPS
jgi:hypothetical protein